MHNKRNTHPCQISATFIQEYLKHFTEESADELNDLIGYGFNTLNRLSGLIKSHPNAPVKKSQFYSIKNMFVYFVYTLCTPVDKVISAYTVTRENVYHKSPYPTYELLFSINGKIYDITVQDSDKFAPGYLKDYFEGFVPNLHYDNAPENDYSGISDFGVYLEYQNFLTWCINHKWFFTMFYDERAVFELLSKIYTNSDYYMHLDPDSPSVLKMFTRPNIFIYRYNKEKHIIEYTKTNIKHVRCIPDFSDKDWESLESHPLIGNKSYPQKYSLYTCDQAVLTLPGYKDMNKTKYNNLPKQIAQAIRHILNNRNLKHNDTTRFFISNK